MIGFRDVAGAKLKSGYGARLSAILYHRRAVPTGLQFLPDLVLLIILNVEVRSNVFHSLQVLKIIIYEAKEYK